ncbi:MAG: hypothetical protein MUE82_02165, partial [Chloroflexi bacterium]|nr:hypothetical protein [Chloroflexota bacterium]
DRPAAWIARRTGWDPPDDDAASGGPVDELGTRRAAPHDAPGPKDAPGPEGAEGSATTPAPS